MKKVVLFDFHNTLVTCDGWLDLEIKSLPTLVLEQLEREGIVGQLPIDYFERSVDLFQQLRNRVHESGHEVTAIDGVAEVCREMDISVARSDIERVVAVLELHLLPLVEPVPGVARALERLRAASCVLGVVSSAGYPPFVEMALESLGLRQFFSEVITSAGEGIYKSDPELYRRAVQRLGAQPSEAVHVGDHLIFDVDSARRAGLSAIWLTAFARRTAEVRGESWYVEIANSRADATIESLDQLYDAVAGLS